MEDKIVIHLRDLTPTKGACKFLASVESQQQDDVEDTYIDYIEQFVKQVSKLKGLNKIKHKDIYIGFWGQQYTFHFNEKFMQMCLKLKVPVMIDFND